MRQQEICKFNINSELIYEFMRYLLVGGIVFIVDFLTLFLTRTFLFYETGQTGILLANALGFTAGLIVNFFLSLSYVFRENTENAKKHKTRSFIVFLIIGITGLLAAHFCMYAGINIFGERWYLVIKCFTSSIVFFLSYFVRKIFIFKGAGFINIR